MLILSVIFTTWFSCFSIFSRSIKRVFDSILLDSGSVPIETLTNDFHRSNISYYDFIILLFNRHGHDLLFSCLSLFAIMVILWSISTHKRKISNEKIGFSILFLGFSLFFVSTLFGSFMSTGSEIRIFCWALMASAILNGIFYYDLLSTLKSNPKKIVSLFLIITLISSSMLGFFSIYYSPHTKNANLQTTEKAFDGMKWFYEYKVDYDIEYIDQLPIRAPSFIYGHTLAPLEKTRNLVVVERNFGYTSSMKETMHNDGKLSYLVISDRNKAVYQELWEGEGLLKSTDFTTLSNDCLSNKIYINGGLELWYRL
jgi:hypothetical protein